jgi:hypothetical protein
LHAYMHTILVNACVYVCIAQVHEDHVAASSLE